MSDSVAGSTAPGPASEELQALRNLWPLLSPTGRQQAVEAANNIKQEGNQAAAMNIYTTCRDCGGPLPATRGETVHPLCTPKPTKVERLAEEWAEAATRGDTERESDLAAQMEAIDNLPPRMLAAALLYASWGWAVFPLKPGTKEPATKHGFKDATTDTGQIKRWWTTNPQANIGLPTGRMFDVVDVDVPEGAINFQRLLETGSMPDSHGHVSTASGGMHHYIKPTGGGNLAGVLPGIDFRGIGGYVVAPPSRLEHRYLSWAWVSHPSPHIKASTTEAATA